MAGAGNTAFLFVVLIHVFFEASLCFTDTIKNIPLPKIPVVVGNVRQGKTISGVFRDRYVFILDFFHDPPTSPDNLQAR